MSRCAEIADMWEFEDVVAFVTFAAEAPAIALPARIKIVHCTESASTSAVTSVRVLESRCNQHSAHKYETIVQAER